MLQITPSALEVIKSLIKDYKTENALDQAYIKISVQKRNCSATNECLSYAMEYVASLGLEDKLVNEQVCTEYGLIDSEVILDYKVSDCEEAFEFNSTKKKCSCGKAFYE